MRHSSCILHQCQRITLSKMDSLYSIQHKCLDFQGAHTALFQGKRDSSAKKGQISPPPPLCGILYNTIIVSPMYIYTLRCCWPKVMIPSSLASQGDCNGGFALLFRQKITIDFIVYKAVHSRVLHRSGQLRVMGTIIHVTCKSYLIPIFVDRMAWWLGPKNMSSETWGWNMM